MKIEKFIIEEMTDDCELLKAIRNNEEIDAKDLSFDDKVSFLKWCLKDLSMTNPIILTNLSLIILGSNLSDSVFEMPSIYFKNVEEYVDIKYELKQEIRDFNNTFAKYYIGVLKSVSIFFDNEKVFMENIYWNLMNVATIDQMGKILSKASFNVNEVPLFRNSEIIINNLCSKNKVANSLSKLFNQE